MQKKRRKIRLFVNIDLLVQINESVIFEMKITYNIKCYVYQNFNINIYICVHNNHIANFNNEVIKNFSFHKIKQNRRLTI